MPKTLEERLNAHPELKAQLLALLELAESDITSADEVEERTVEPIRSLGRQVIHDWAKQQEQKISQSVRETIGQELEHKSVQEAVRQALEQKGKKNSTGPRHTER